MSNPRANGLRRRPGCSALVQKAFLFATHTIPFSTIATLRPPVPDLSWTVANLTEPAWRARNSPYRLGGEFSDNTSAGATGYACPNANRHRPRTGPVFGAHAVRAGLLWVCGRLDYRSVRRRTA